MLAPQVAVASFSSLGEGGVVILEAVDVAVVGDADEQRAGVEAVGLECSQACVEFGRSLGVHVVEPFGDAARLVVVDQPRQRLGVQLRTRNPPSPGEPVGRLEDGVGNRYGGLHERGVKPGHTRRLLERVHVERHTLWTASTTIKSSVETCERLRALGGTTYEDTVIEALDALEANRFFTEAEMPFPWRIDAEGHVFAIDLLRSIPTDRLLERVGRVSPSVAASVQRVTRHIL